MRSTRRQALFAGMGAVGVAAIPATANAGTASAEPDRTSPARRAAASRAPEGQRSADLGNGHFLNPVMSGDHPDPSILKDGETYYQVSSSFVYYPGLVIWRSTDLVNWTPVVPALREPVGSVYAPELIKHAGRFYIYVAVRGVPQMPAAAGARTRKPMTNYVIHADRIEGPWSDPIDIEINNAIDPGHVVGEDGKRYLYVSDGNLIPLSDDGLARTGPDEKRYDGWKYPADWAVETFALEGPKFLHRKGWFYMFSAEGGTAGPPTSHMVVMARSRSIRGPWENSPHNPLVRTRSIAEPWWSRGHGTPVEDAAGQWWMMYHGYEHGYRTLGRQTLLEPVEWTADGWLRATGGDLSRPLAKPAGKRGPNGVALGGPFDERSFGARVTFFKPGPGYMNRVRFADGALILSGQGKDPGAASPLVFNAGDRNYMLSAELELEGAITGGLLLFYNEKFFCGMASDPDRIRAYAMGGEGMFEPRTPAIGRRLHLRVINEDQVGRFYYSADGKVWTLHRSYEVSGYNHNIAGGYLSLRPAIFAAGEGSVTIRILAYTAL
jgi:xylan 1,4-beta-xylosidase